MLSLTRFFGQSLILTHPDLKEPIIVSVQNDLRHARAVRIGIIANASVNVIRAELAKSIPKEPLSAPPAQFFCEHRRDAKYAIPHLTYQYIERLEAIARAADRYSELMDTHRHTPEEYKAAEDLLTALEAVNFLDEEEVNNHAV